ncbi:dihydrolipoyllysine-residue acetyltransferase [Pseudomonas sp. F1_0610]|uniref:dihydrolipoyllysine-residue acetyltransferase n=1 Tax=Pseudomonas sp. F1_0610 TaxID=3114284 RepID=UPI0039C07B15
MSELIRVPDLGGEGEVIEILVKVGDHIEKDQGLVTLESDKASMEIPAPKAGVIKALHFKMGDRLKEGDDLLELDIEAAAVSEPAPAKAVQAPEQVAAPAAATAATASVEEILVPDLGGEGQVIEIMVREGDPVEKDQSLFTLESDKASMEIPAPKAGIIKKLHFKMGDQLKEGDPLMALEVVSEASATAAPAPASVAAMNASVASQNTVPSVPAAGTAQVKELLVPDLGGEGQVIEIMVKEGDLVEKDQGILTLESDKASMEIPAPEAGVIKKLHFKMGDRLKEGDKFIALEVAGAAPLASSTPAHIEPVMAPIAAEQGRVGAEFAPTDDMESKLARQVTDQPRKESTKVHAGPAVRLLAREFGIDLVNVKATGPHGRILKEDVQLYVKTLVKTQAEGGSATTQGAGIPAIPEVDFSRFGEIEEVPMSRLRQIGAQNLHRSWLNVPHVTQFESADITDLEAFRKAQKLAAEKAGTKLTVLPFLIKACAQMLKELPDFNSSLAASGKALIHKKYVHIGFAVDTPDGLLVPVIRDADQKSLLQLSKEAAELADKARNKQLKPEQMQGACFTISSLGHIGGTGFTPIVNAPEVAILGVSRATMQPVWDGKAFEPRLMLPLSLSYDHRVINGAAAALFTRRLSDVLADIRSMLL